MIVKADCNGTFYSTRYAAANFKRLLPFLDAVDALNGQSFSFDSAGYEPLSVENLGTTFMGCPVYAMAHVYVMNGDLMSDPDMSFYVDRARGLVIPLTFQQDNCPFAPGGTLWENVFEDETHYRPRLMTELDDFLNTWTKNILDQGFSPAEAEAMLTA